MALKEYQSGTQGSKNLEAIPQSVKSLDMAALIDRLNTFTEWLKNNPTEGGANYDDAALVAAIAALQLGKQNNLVSGTNVKTINGTSLLGSGDVAITGGTPYDDSAIQSTVSALQTGKVDKVAGKSLLSDTEITRLLTLSNYNDSTILAEKVRRAINSTISGVNAEAIGSGQIASGNNSFAEGANNKALGDFSHAEGYDNEASNNQAHVEGAQNYAQGQQSHAEGLLTVAYGHQSHSEGWGTNAYGKVQHAGGKFNVSQGTQGSIADTDIAWMIGNGSDDANRSNAAELLWNGTLRATEMENFVGTKHLMLDTDKSKLDGIASGAQVNNISDVNATDLTDGGDTTLHIHDTRYNTKSEITTLISGIAVPTSLSQLADDATHRLVTDTEKSTWNAKQPAMGTDDNYVTDVEKAALHTHSNKIALDAVSGTNTGDQTLSGLGGVSANVAITGATKTKVTYDSKGLITSGADATTGDIADSTNKRYVTDAQLTVIGNTSGANTGDETVSTIKTKLGITTLSGSNTGDDAANSLYSGLAASKQNTLVSGTSIKTINSVSLLGSGDIAIAGGTPFAMYQLASPVSNSTTTLADVTAWSFSVTAGKVYRIEIIALYQTNTTTTGGKLGFYLPSGTGTIVGFMEGGISSSTVATELKAPIYAIGASNAAGSFLLTTGVSIINTPHHIDGSLIFTCATSGIFRAQWAGEAATAAQLNTGSVMLVTVLN